MFLQTQALKHVMSWERERERKNKRGMEKEKEKENAADLYRQAANVLKHAYFYPPNPQSAPSLSPTETHRDISVIQTSDDITTLLMKRSLSHVPNMYHLIHPLLALARLRCQYYDSDSIQLAQTQAQIDALLEGVSAYRQALLLHHALLPTLVHNDETASGEGEVEGGGKGGGGGGYQQAHNTQLQVLIEAMECSELAAKHTQIQKQEYDREIEIEKWLREGYLLHRGIYGRRRKQEHEQNQGEMAMGMNIEGERLLRSLQNLKQKQKLRTSTGTGTGNEEQFTRTQKYSEGQVKTKTVDIDKTSIKTKIFYRKRIMKQKTKIIA